MAVSEKEIIDQETTDGSLFLNIYNDGSFEVESINGGRVSASADDWLLVIRPLMGRLRATKEMR